MSTSGGNAPYGRCHVVPLAVLLLAFGLRVTGEAAGSWHSCRRGRVEKPVYSADIGRES